MCNNKILYNQYKYTWTDPVFKLHRLPSRSKCYIKPLVFTHNTSHVLNKRVVVWERLSYQDFVLHLHHKTDSRCHHCTVSLNTQLFKCHHVSACDGDSDTVVGEMAFAPSLKPALTLLDSRGGQNMMSRETPKLQNQEATQLVIQPKLI